MEYVIQLMVRGPTIFSIGVLGVSSNEPDGSGGEVNGSEEVASSFVVSGGDGGEQLEFGEEVFNQVARFVEFLVILALNFSICFGRDDSLFSGLLQRVQHPFVGVKALSAITVLALSCGSRTSAPSSSQACPCVR
ncbi:MAG TPA: hypothetical protein VGB94_09445 [Acidobacteriaceae bacterium]